MNLTFHQLTTAGDREINQDYMVSCVDSEYAYFVVADGLGGHHAGEKASQYFCLGLKKHAEMFLTNLEIQPAELLMLWIDAAVEEMRIMFGEDPEASEAHTTCAVLYLDRKRVMTAHCGDSRVYRLTPNRILWRTRDHSMLQGMVDSGEIEDAQMGGHPGQNFLLRSINVANKFEIEVQVHPASCPGETFILCTDGFWENVKSQELHRLAQPECGLEELEKITKLSWLRGNGKSDNITVQWVRLL